MMKSKFETIVVRFPDRPVAVMSVLIAAPVASLSEEAAKAAGFALSKAKTSWVRKATSEVIEAEIGRTTGLSPNAGWRIVGKDELPKDRSLRDAWTDDGSVLLVDMPRARDIVRTRLRAARKPMLEALDVDYQRADEAGDRATKGEVAAKKQRLRDITSDPSIDAAATPVALMVAALKLTAFVNA